MMVVNECPSPLHGAAFQKLFEATEACYCTTRMRQAEIKAYFQTVTYWARKQSIEVHAAYIWAIMRLEADLENQIKIHELSNGVQQSIQLIPVPPSMKEVVGKED